MRRRQQTRTSSKAEPVAGAHHLPHTPTPSLALSQLVLRNVHFRRSCVFKMQVPLCFLHALLA
jgi:hypothetical protein